jgi:hypothetical protein
LAIAVKLKEILGLIIERAGDEARAAASIADKNQR